MNEIATAIIGLAGVIIGSLITIAGQWLGEKHKKSRELAYAAVVIAFTAKRLASETLDIASDFDVFQQTSNEEHNHYPHDTPALDLTDFDINWRVIPDRCLDRLFECRARLSENAKFYNKPMAYNMDTVACDACKLLDLIEICDMLLAVASELREKAKMSKDEPLAVRGSSRDYYIERLQMYAR